MAIFVEMNLFNLHYSNKWVLAEGWIAKIEVPFLRRKLVELTRRYAFFVAPVVVVIKTRLAPPTYYRTNKFTEGFQALINSYGIGAYGEMNPAPYTIITFPFLFAVMFGDTGHGIIMTLSAIWLISLEKHMKKQMRSEILMLLYGGRYIILLMGLFSIYTGIIYNDMFGKAINAFGSSWCPRNLSWEFVQEVSRLI